MKTKYRLFKAFFLTFFIASAPFFHSCDYSYLDILDEDVHYTYEPTYALPVVKSVITINDLFDVDEEPTIVIQDDNLIKLVYCGRVYSLRAEDLFYIESLESDFSYSYSPPSKSDNVSETFQFYFDMAGQVRIDEFKFRSGQLEIDISADELINDGYELAFAVNIQNSDDGFGNEFSEEFLLQNTPVEFDLDGYTFVFEEDDEGNYLNIDYTISVVTHGEHNPPYDLVFTKTIKDNDAIQYEHIIGYLDNFDFSVGTDTIELGIYKESTLSEIFFKEPYMDVFAENSIGLPLDIHFDRFIFYNDEGDTTNVGGHGFHDNNPWRINYPSVMGQTEMTDITLDRNNTNLDDLLAISPIEAKYEVRGETNPDQDTGISNFIRYDSRFDIDVEINLPLHGNVQNYRFLDTLEFSMKEHEAGEIIEWIELKFVIDNGFPIDLAMQAYFLDENDNVLAGLFEDYEEIFKAAKVDTEGKVTEETREETIIFVEHDKIDEVADAEYIVVSFSAATQQESNPPKGSGDPFSVKIYDYYTVGVQLGTRVKLSADLEF